jgi:hypothetical protein
VASTSQWRLEKSPSTTLEPWESPLDIAEDFEVDALHELVVTDPANQRMLPTLLSMLEMASATPRTKLIIVAPDDRAALRWIALGTLFLEFSEALQTSFSVNVEDAMSSTAAIVAVCPPLASAVIDHRNAPGVNVFDVIEHQTSTVDISETAARHAEWFLNAEPYAALEAVELSRRWAQRVPGETAARAAWFACTASEFPSYGDIVALSETLVAVSTADGDDLDAYGDAMLDVIATYRPEQGVSIEPIVRAIRALAETGEDGLATAAALSALEWAAVLPTSAREWASTAPPPGATPLVWQDPEAREHACHLLTDIIGAASAGEIPAVLTLANYLNVGITEREIGPTLDNLAAAIVRQSSLASGVVTWALGDEVLARVRASLAEELSADPAGAVARAWRQGHWDWLALASDARSDGGFGPWARGREVALAPPAETVRKLHALGADAPASAWSAFFDPHGSAASVDAVTAWLMDHPVVSPGFDSVVDQAIRNEMSMRTPSPRLPELLAWLANQPEGDVGVAYPLAASYIDVGQRVATARDALNARTNAPLRSLAHVPVSVLALHRSEIAYLIVCASDVPAARHVASVVSGTSGDAIREVIGQRLKQGDDRVFGSALRIARSEGAYPSAVVDTVIDELGAFWTGRETRGNVPTLIAKLGPAFEDDVKAFEDLRKKGRIARAVTATARRATNRRQ